MPQITFSTENKVKTNNNYPLLTLDYDERALVILIEPAPTMEYRHTLVAPEIGPDGKVLKETKEGRGGKPYDVTQTEFIGRHLCFGNFDVLQAKGVDPDSCPTCAAAVEGNGIEPPKEHYAMHVIRYALKPNSWQIRDPFTVTCEAWTFAGNRFNQLVDLAADWDDLRKHDAKLGPCENKQYQKYDINVIQKAEWLQSDERKKRVAEEYANNKCPDLAALIARRADKGQVIEDIARVQERYAQAYGLSTGVVAMPTQQTQTMDADIAALLGDDEPKESSNVPDPFNGEAEDGLSVFKDSDTDSIESEPTTTKKTRAKKAEAVEPEKSDAGTVADMDDILKLLQ